MFNRTSKTQKIAEAQKAEHLVASIKTNHTQNKLEVLEDEIWTLIQAQQAKDKINESKNSTLEIIESSEGTQLLENEISSDEDQIIINILSTLEGSEEDEIRIIVDQYKKTIEEEK